MRVSVVLALLLFGCLGRARGEPVGIEALASRVADGDLIFQESRSRQSAAVKAATGSRYSHMGLIFGAGTARPVVLEAVGPVKKTPLARFIARGEGRHFVIMRVRGGLARAEQQKLKRESERYFGKPYDTTFDWSDARIYCSELVWKAYERALGRRLGEPQPFSALSLSSPLVRELSEQRLGKQPDAEAQVITPVRMFESDALETVLSGTLLD